MPSRREVLSPLTTTPNIPTKTLTPKSLVALSPSTSRHNTLQNVTPLLTAEHDDEKERKERRRSKIVELQRRNLGSPSSPADRRSAALNGLTLTQLTEHYTNCIKLSAENKINSKNAFGLHLIDYMSELMKKKELENFQVASSTLDASAKIYAGRVDAIHAETYKVLTGLGRGSEKKAGDEDNEDEMSEPKDGDENAREGEAVKKRKVRKSHTIETNLKNITVNKLDLEFEVDPLFHMMSATFDEGGTNGLLLNNLRCYDDSQQLILDSSTVVSPFVSCVEESGTTGCVDIKEMEDLFNKMNIEELQICPTFANFQFTNWDGSTDTILDTPKPGQSEHMFDLDAEAEPIDEPEDDIHDTYHPDDVGDDDQPHNDSFPTENDTCLFQQGMQIGDGKAAQLVQTALQDMTQSSVGSLMQILAEEPSDYSYFNKALMRTWAGPSHWRIGPLSKDPKFKTFDKDMKNKTKTKKAAFKNDFDEEIEFEKYFKYSKSATLTKATMSKYSKEQTTLPKDLHYDADKLFRVFRKPKLMIKRQNESLGVTVDNEIQNYDYENANDRENYCPNNFEVDDDGCNDDEQEGFGEFTQDSSQDLFSTSNPSMLSNDTTLSGTLVGDRLVAQPYKVAKIDISYAKTAKKLDVKRLKGAMWSLLSEAGEQKEISPMESPKQDKVMEEDMAFQELLTSLPSKVPNQTARNLSVPIAFVCLLHLANEKTLKIIAREDMSDLQISQGI